MTLTAPNVNIANAASETPYTFQLVFTDDNLVDASSLPSSTAEVAPPSGSPITATMLGSPVTSGTTDALGDAQQITVTYQITPPAGTWSASPDGTYTVQLDGPPVTDLANNSAPTGTIGTFSNLITPTVVVVTDAGGNYNGQPFAATATVAAVVAGAVQTPVTSLEGVSPTLAYYVGTSASGMALAGAPTNAGTYTVVASFAGSADYESATSDPVTFTILPSPLTVTPADWTSAGLTLTLGSDGNLHAYITDTTTDAVPPVAGVSVSNIAIASPSSTTASLTIDSTNGDPIPAGGLNYSGAGGLIITGPGTVTLSGPNSYTGGTTVSAGTLLITAVSALPDGGSLTVGADASSIFGASQAASSLSAAGLVAPMPDTVATSQTSTPIVVASALDNVPVTASTHSTLSPFLERQVKNLSYVPALSATSGSTSEMPAVVSSARVDAVFASHRSAFGQTVSPADNAQSALPWAWLAAMESSWNSSDQDKTTDLNVEALNKVFARFGL